MPYIQYPPKVRYHSVKFAVSQADYRAILVHHERWLSNLITDEEFRQWGVIPLWQKYSPLDVPDYLEWEGSGSHSRTSNNPKRPSFSRQSVRLLVLPLSEVDKMKLTLHGHEVQEVIE